MARILLTGSTGFLGTRAVDLWRDRHEVVGLSKSDPTNPVDIQDIDALGAVFQDARPDFVVHTAAFVSHHASDLSGPNIEGTRNVVELAKQAGTPVIFTSTESVYGGKEGTG